MNIDADFSKSKPDEHLEAIRQEHESFLTQLEALAVIAIATNDWDAFYQHLRTYAGTLYVVVLGLTHLI